MEELTSTTQEDEYEHSKRGRSLLDILLDLSLKAEEVKNHLEIAVRVAETAKRIGDLGFALLKVPFEILSVGEKFIDVVLGLEEEKKRRKGE
jgi:hypothetical protein